MWLNNSVFKALKRSLASQNIEAELGGILLDPEAISRVAIASSQMPLHQRP